MPDTLPRHLSLGVMAKYWEPGKVKTRLAASIGDQRAAQLHLVFCRQLAKELAAAADRRGFVVTPEHRAGQFREWLGRDWELGLQCEGDLGARMKGWFRETRRDGDPGRSARDAVLIGADCPVLTTAQVESAGTRLHNDDIVLGPALDGGYYLIGLRGVWREEYECLFDAMPWSEPGLFDATIERAERAGLSVAVLEPMEDIDTISELESLLHRLGQLPGAPVMLAREIERVLASEAAR